MPGVKKHDIVYLSLLAIAGSCLATLLLFCLYCWYATGQIPLLHGLPASMASAESARFWIGSIYVPMFLGFVGIVIAHRLLSPAGGARLSPPLSRGRVIEMADESDSGTLEGVLDTLSGPEAANAKYRGMFRNGPAAAGWGADQWQSQPVEQYAPSHAAAGDAGPGFRSTMPADMIADGDALARTGPADVNARAVDPVPTIAPSGEAVAVEPAHDHDAVLVQPATPAKTEPVRAKRKESRNEADFLELLKDPANREKLVMLLTDAEL